MDTISKNVSNLPEHESRHICKKCGQTLGGMKVLKAHQWQHGHSPCPYEDCPKSFTRKYDMRRHVSNQHEGRKLYCEGCRISFRKDKKRRHTNCQNIVANSNCNDSKAGEILQYIRPVNMSHGGDYRGGHPVGALLDMHQDTGDGHSDAGLREYINMDWGDPDWVLDGADYEAEKAS